jgi:hypothetical protein
MILAFGAGVNDALSGVGRADSGRVLLNPRGGTQIIRHSCGCLLRRLSPSDSGSGSASVPATVSPKIGEEE